MFKKIVPTLLTLLMMLLMLLAPQVCIEGATKGLLLWFQKVLPSLFPFMVLINLLCYLGTFFKASHYLTPFTKPLLGLSGSSFSVFVLGLISGYPMGIKMSKTLFDRGELSLCEAQKTLTISSNCGPLFIVGTVGTLMLGQVELGYFLLVIHLFSALIMLLLSRFYTLPLQSSHRITKVAPSMNFASALTLSVQNAMDTIVYVGGYIIFFSVIITFLQHSSCYDSLWSAMGDLLNLDPRMLSTFFLSLFEFSTGSALLTQSLPINLTYFAFIATILSFGGLCVLFQSYSIILDSSLSLKPYFILKILQGLLAFILTFLLYPLYCIVSHSSITIFPLAFIFLIPLLILVVFTFKRLSLYFCTY